MKKYIVLALTAIICLTSHAQSKKEDWAQFYRYEKANKFITTRPDAVFMGNSITDFWAKMDSAFFNEHNFVGRGISGQTTSEMLVRFRQDVINLNPKSVIILAGINDIAENNKKITLENILGNIISMAELAKCHDIKVVLCSVLPCDRFSWRPEMQPAKKVVELNKMIRNYAAENGITYVDYYSALATPEGAIKPEYSNDGCHPTLPAYKIMEDILITTINK